VPPSYPRASIVSSGEVRGARRSSAAARTRRRAGRRDVVAQRQLERMKSWKTRVTASATTADRAREVDAVDLDRTRLRVVQRHSSLASVVLPAPFCPTMASDEPGRDREIEVAARVPPGRRT
jgi:hypothetical protein